MEDSRLSSTSWSSGHSRVLASCRRSLSCVTSCSPRYSVDGIPSRSDDPPSHVTTPASCVKSACRSAGAAELEASPPAVPPPLPIHCRMSPPCDPTLAFGPRMSARRAARGVNQADLEVNSRTFDVLGSVSLTYEPLYSNLSKEHTELSHPLSTRQTRVFTSRVSRLVNR